MRVLPALASWIRLALVVGGLVAASAYAGSTTPDRGAQFASIPVHVDAGVEAGKKAPELPLAPDLGWDREPFADSTGRAAPRRIDRNPSRSGRTAHDGPRGPPR